MRLQLEKKRTSSETEDAKLVDKNTGEILIIPSPDDQHTDKNIVAEHDNYWQIKNGEVFSTKIIQVLRSHPDATINKPVKDAITQEALSRIDRMSNETFMAHVSSRLQEAVRDAGPVEVTVDSNVRYGEEGNKRKKIECKYMKQLPVGLMAQLVGHCTGIAGVMGSNPVQALIFFRLSFRNCLSCVVTARIFLLFEKKD